MLSLSKHLFVIDLLLVDNKKEGSHSGLVRTLGKRVWGNPPRVRIPYPPPSVAVAPSECEERRRPSLVIKFQLFCFRFSKWNISGKHSISFEINWKVKDRERSNVAQKSI